MSHASNYSGMFDPKDEQMQMELEYAEDYERWSREREAWDNENCDGYCAFCGDPVFADHDFNWLPDNLLVHKQCRAGECTMCLSSPGDLVKVGQCWEMRCQNCEAQERAEVSA